MTDSPAVTPDAVRQALHGWATGDYGHMEAAQAHGILAAAARLWLSSQEESPLNTDLNYNKLQEESDSS